MAREGSMKDPAARASAGHSVANDPPGDNEEGEVRQPRKPAAKQPARAARTGFQKQQDALARDKELLRNAPEEDDGDVLDTEEDDEPISGPKRKPARNGKEKPFFEYRGKKFASQDDLEDYLDELEVQGRRRETRQDPPPRQKEPEKPKEFEVDEKTFFDKPGETFKKFADHLFERLQDVLAKDVIGPQKGDQVMRDFWRDFYSDHPEFKDRKYRKIVEGIFQENLDTIGELTPDRANKRLARLAKREFEDLGIPLTRKEKDRQEEEELLEHRTSVEGGQGPRRRAPAGNRQEERPATLTELIRARKNARLDARTETRA